MTHTRKRTFQKLKGHLVHMMTHTMEELSGNFRLFLACELLTCEKVT